MVSKQAVAGAQILISIIFIGGYFVVLWDFIHGRIAAPIEWKEVLISLISLLTAGVLTILHFWFSRSRPQDNNGSPDSNP
jgi:hypothetical protein